MSRLRLVGQEARRLPPPPRSQTAMIAFVVGLIAAGTLALNFTVEAGPVLDTIAMPCAILAVVLGLFEIKNIRQSFGAFRGIPWALAGAILGGVYIAAFFIFTGPVLLRLIVGP